MRILLTGALLTLSNTFMTFAWYYHLKRPAWPLLMAIGISWLIALPEYVLQVPANRLGHIGHGGPLSAPQLKVLQEAITLIVFSVFTLTVLHERPRPADYIAFALIMCAVAVSMLGGGAISGHKHPMAP
ncbi:MAG: DMT family protein [Phycisphaerales bacterium JB039]